jgi:glycerol kinase
VIRATVESLAYQVSDLMAVMEEVAGMQIAALKVDGGASANDFLLQFQSDILQVPVLRPETYETTALGAAYLAGLAVGYYRDLDEIRTNWKLGQRFDPQMDLEEMSNLICGWKKAVTRSFGLAKDI